MSRDSAQDEEDASSEDDSAFDSLLREVARVDDEPLVPLLPQPGQVIGEKYRIEERIGRGGMGAVFRASHVVSDKAVAVKWMLRSASDEKAHRRFLREARVAGRIDHPNVVNVYDVGQDGDSGYLVMELLHGEALRARLQRGALAVSEALDLLLPAMHGVAAVHRAGVIHRDLKPDNIFLCQAPDGTPREAKVLDFGISAMSACDPTDPTLTQDGAVLGTPAYMSPEQLQNVRDVDARSDVYAFGVILYEALTGSLPFEAESYPGLVLAIVSARPRSPRALRADVPRGLEQVVLRALAKAPADRYPSIDALIAGLTPFAGSGAQRTAVIAAPRRRTQLWALALAVLIAVGGAAWLFKTQPPSVANPSLTPSPSPSPSPTEEKKLNRQDAKAPKDQNSNPVAPWRLGGLNPSPNLTPSPSPSPSPSLSPTPTSPRVRKPKPPTTAPTTKPPASPPASRSGSISLDQL